MRGEETRRTRKRNNIVARMHVRLRGKERVCASLRGLGNRVYFLKRTTTRNAKGKLATSSRGRVRDSRQMSMGPIRSETFLIGQLEDVTKWDEMGSSY